MSNDETASAAAALASLMARVQAATISGPPTAPPPDNNNNNNNTQEIDDHNHHYHDDEEDEEENDDGSFKIPQRYTKSGRKRAVSFPLKVSPQCRSTSLLSLSLLDQICFHSRHFSPISDSWLVGAVPPFSYSRSS